jgi:hypothetical protein
MSIIELDRRMFLRGTAGAILAIPFLPSLSREARAGEAGAKLPRFVAMATDHGGVWTTAMFPVTTPVTEQMNYRGHTIRKGNLAVNQGEISKVLRGDPAKLTAALAAKMNVIRGLDLSYYAGHHTGCHLGNYARNDGNGGDGQKMQAFPRPTIDQVMAWSPSFYPDIATIKERSLVIGDRISYYWSNPKNKNGEIQELKPEFSSQELFNRIFVPPQNGNQTRTPLVNRILDNYKRLRGGNRRLSSADRVRLDEHIERLNELDRKLNTKVSCDTVAPPTKNSMSVMNGNQDFWIRPDLHGEFWSLLNDVIAAAFSCNTCRVVTMHIKQTFSDYQGDWHQSVAHQANIEDNPAQGIIREAHRRTFESVFLDLATKLDAIDEGDGTKVLDNTLLHWTQESGNITHDCNSIPIVTAGSAAGWMKTGQYIDYHNQDKPYGKWPNTSVPEDRLQKCGLLYNQWLGNVLDAMRVPRSEWEAYSDNGGYGKLLIGDGYENYDPAVTTSMNEVLPWLKA